MNTSISIAADTSARAATPRPSFEVPWPSACAPDAAQIESRMLGWAQSHGLFLNEEHHRRTVRARFAWLAARCYPHAERSLLQVIANYIACFFLIDDLFVDRVETASPATVPALAAMLDVMDFNRLGEHPVYGESAWLDVCQQFRQLLPAEHFERFANGMRLWATVAGLQILNHLDDRPPGMPTYIAVRRYMGGVYPTLDLIDAANAALLPSAVHALPEVQALRLHANNIVGWSNDAHSVDVEMKQPGQFWNMVTIYAAQGHSLGDAINHTAATIRAEISQFFTLAADVEQHADPVLRVYVAGIKDWLRGYFDWLEHDTQRYAPQFAEQDADDRALLPSISAAEPQRTALSSA